MTLPDKRILVEAVGLAYLAYSGVLAVVLRKGNKSNAVGR